MIDDWSFLEDGMMKIDPSPSSMCIHVVVDVGIGMCKKLVLAELGTSSKHKE